MSNNKQSSVEWLLDRIEDVDLTPQIWEKIKQQAKAMHKAEIIDSFGVGCQVESTRLIGYHGMAEQYYKETYGGNNENN